MARGSRIAIRFILIAIGVMAFGSPVLAHLDQHALQAGSRPLTVSGDTEGFTKTTEPPDPRAFPEMKTALISETPVNSRGERDGGLQNPDKPTTDLSGFSVPVLLWIAFVMLVSGLAHGIIGFGFPIVATPLLTLVLPMKQTILISLVPTLMMTALNALRGGRLRESIGRYWYLPLLLMIGAFAGTRLLLVAPNEPFVLLLAVVLFVYLNMERLGKTNVPIVRGHPAVSAVVFGLASGVFEATANVSGASLLIYFMLIGLSPRSLVQTLNFAFVAGKFSQTATWTVSGGIGLAAWAQTLPWALLATVTLLFGRRIHDRIDAETYMRWLRGFLWAMVVMLVVQFARLMVARFA
jgi:uncharacterized membrane protein YfcA